MNFNRNEIHVEQRHLSETNFERRIRRNVRKKRIEFQFQVLTNFLRILNDQKWVINEIGGNGILGLTQLFPSRFSTPIGFDL